MTQGRSPSQSQIVQVQVRTGCGGGRWGAQAGESCIPEALLLLQLLLQGTDLLQVSLYQGPLQGKTEGSGSGQRQEAPWTPGPKGPQGQVAITPQTGAEVAKVPHSHSKWPQVRGLPSQHLQCRCLWLLWLARSEPILFPVTIAQGHLYKDSALGPATPPPQECSFHFWASAASCIRWG